MYDCVSHCSVWQRSRLYKGLFTLSDNSAMLLSDASNTVLIEKNGFTEKWVAVRIWSNSIVFNENSITSFLAKLSQH